MAKPHIFNLLTCRSQDIKQQGKNLIFTLSFQKEKRKIGSYIRASKDKQDFGKQKQLFLLWDANWDIFIKFIAYFTFSRRWAKIPKLKLPCFRYT